MSWTWTVTTASNVAGAALVAVFGILVLAVRPRTPQATTVAVFSVAFGAATGGINLLQVGPGTALGQALGWIGGVASVVTSGALLVMWWILPTPLRTGGRLLVLPSLVAAAGLAFLSVPVFTGGVESSIVADLGPGSRLYFGAVGLQVAIWWGLVLLLASRFARGDGEADELPLLASALSLYPFAATTFLFGNDPALTRLSWFGLAAALVVAAAWLRAGHRAGRPRAGRAVAWVILGAALAGLLESALFDGFARGLHGVARIATVAVLSYAVVRHQVLGIDVKLRWGISKGSVAAAFVAVFFVASEAAQEFLGGALGGQYVGIAAAGALVFAIAPLQRAAERLAERAVPVTAVEVAPPRAGGGPEAWRCDAFKAGVRAALADGPLTPLKELHLADLQHHLGIGARDAVRLRHEIERESEVAP